MDKISALMDGELDDRQADQALTGLRERGELRQVWDTFHLIGDALRGERLLLTDVAGGLSRRLADEPTVVAPRRRAARRLTTYALSLAASLAAVAFVGWVALAPQPAPQEIAAARAPVAVPTLVAVPTPVAAPAAVMPVVSLPDEGRRSEYLLAHQGFSPSTAILGVAPYVRSVSAPHATKDR